MLQKTSRAGDARRTLGDSYLHSIHCDAKPEKFNDGFWYHQECYNYFTKAASDREKKNDDSEANKTKSVSSALKTDYALSRSSAHKRNKFCMVILALMHLLQKSRAKNA